MDNDGKRKEMLQNEKKYSSALSMNHKKEQCRNANQIQIQAVFYIFSSNLKEQQKTKTKQETYKANRKQMIQQILVNQFYIW